MQVHLSLKNDRIMLFRQSAYEHLATLGFSLVDETGPRHGVRWLTIVPKFQVLEINSLEELVELQKKTKWPLRIQYTLDGRLDVSIENNEVYTV